MVITESSCPRHDLIAPGLAAHQASTTATAEARRSCPDSIHSATPFGAGRCRTRCCWRVLTLGAVHPPRSEHSFGNNFDFGGETGGGAPRKCLQHQSKTGNVLSIAPDNGHMGDHHAHYTQTSHHVAPTRDTVFSIALRSLALLQLLLRIISSYWHGSAIRWCMDSSGLLHLRQPIAGDAKFPRTTHQSMHLRATLPGN